MKSAAIRKNRVFLVDDHPIIRRGFQLLLTMEPDFTVCGEADSGPVALEKIQAMKPDVAVVDLSLKASSGLELIKQLAAVQPQLKILVFTMRAETIYAERALRAGAQGYITKEEGTEKAIEAMRLLLKGEVYVSPQLADSMVAQLAGQAGAASPQRLSDREMEILELVGAGLSTREIAAKLALSVKTIESHREHIKSKLNLKSASELSNYAFKWVSGQ